MVAYAMNASMTVVCLTLSHADTDVTVDGVRAFCAEILLISALRARLGGVFLGVDLIE
jgi:hypothetical protein